MTLANFITGFRLLPFALFIFFAHQEQIAWAASMFFIAWALDAVDGLAARQLHQETRFGYIFDKVVDRTVLVGSLLVLITLGLAPLPALLLLTKDIMIVPAVVREGALDAPLRDLGHVGKIFAVWQGAAVVWLLSAWPFGLVMIAITAIAGAAVGSWHLRQLRPAP